MKNLLSATLFFRAVICSACVLLLPACAANQQNIENQIVVSIQPLRFIVEEIVGDDFEIEVLVPPGASPETYEPTPAQIKATETSKLLFSTGLIGFERALFVRLSGTAGVSDGRKALLAERFVDLSAGIELIGGDDFRSTHEGVHHVHSHAHGGHHGVDPHIWVSPKSLRKMAETAYARINELFPDSTSYTANYVQLAKRLQYLDEEVGKRIAVSSRVSAPASSAQSMLPVRSFLIFHPGLTYYARDYGLRQIALEHDGKEPSTKQLQEIIALAHTENISKVLYQSEFPRGVVEVVAAEIGAEPVEIDILNYDIVDNILKITELIVGQK